MFGVAVAEVILDQPQVVALVGKEKSARMGLCCSRHSRHTKGMNLLQAGVSLEIIRDFLGHEGVVTTQIYARANLEMKREALEKVGHAATFPDMPSWKKDSTLLEWLSAL